MPAFLLATSCALLSLPAMVAPNAAPMTARPLLERLADALRAAILDGRIPPERKMPTEEQLVEDLDVGQSTVSRAFRMLGDVAWSYSCQGAGASAHRPQ